MLLLLLMEEIPINHLGCIEFENNGINYQPQLVLLNNQQYLPTQKKLVGGFDPSEKYYSKWESSPIFGVKMKNIWNHHPDNHCFCYVFVFYWKMYWNHKKPKASSTKFHTHEKSWLNKIFWMPGGLIPSFPFLIWHSRLQHHGFATQSCFMGFSWGVHPHPRPWKVLGGSSQDL